MSKQQCKTNCCVFGCKARKKDNPSLHFHHFPKLGESRVGVRNKCGVLENVDRRFAWLKVLRLGEPNGKQVSRHMLVCSRHFKQTDYILFGFSTTSPRLKKNAIPSMNLPPKPIKPKNNNERIDEGKRCERVGRPQEMSKESGSTPQSHDLDCSVIDYGDHNYCRRTTACPTVNASVPAVQLAEFSNEERIGNDASCSRMAKKSQDNTNCCVPGCHTCRKFDNTQRTWLLLQSFKEESMGRCVKNGKTCNKPHEVFIKKRRLKRTAIPSLNLPIAVVQGKPLENLDKASKVFYQPTNFARKKVRPAKALVKNKMLEPTAIIVDDVYSCSQCSHQTASVFQLGHHVRRKHNYLYATQLFDAIVEPEQFSCTCCDYTNNYRLELHEHFKQTHIPKTCDHYRYEPDSNLSLLFVKHHDLQQLQRPRQATNEVDEEMESNIWTQHDSSEKVYRFYCNHCSYRSTTTSSLKRHKKLKHIPGEKQRTSSSASIASTH